MFSHDARHHARRGALLVFTLIIITPYAALAGINDLVITEVDPVGNLVEVTHNSTDTYTVTGSALFFCHQLDYSDTIPLATVFNPGESKTFSVGLSDSGSDIWLYINGSNFNNGASIITGMQYGFGNQGRTALAATQGLWPDGASFVPLPAGGETLQLLTTDATNPGAWDSRAATAGSYFGTGIEITDPISPNITKGSVVIETTTVASGLTAPQGLVPLPDGANRNLVFEQTGEVHLMDGGTLNPTLYLDVSSRLVALGAFGPGSFDERGLIGLAVSPNYNVDGHIYTYTSEPLAGAADFSTTPPTGGFNHQAVFAEWTVDGGNPDIINVASRREILRIDQPQFNHNGGAMHFGADGFLYIALGDGGGRDDEAEGHGTDGNGQDPFNIYGTILRIDPNGSNGVNGQYGIPAGNPFIGGASGLEEIWAYGLRNPFSFSFDSVGGDLYVADVGQGDIEEINRVAAGDNLGWRLKEGSFFFDPNGIDNGFVTTIPVAPIPAGVVDPIAEYDHDDGLAIIGGFVYRGSAVPSLAGLYVFGEFGFFTGTSGRLFYMDPSLGTPQIFEFQISGADVPLGFAVKGMGQDAAGELYVLASNDVTPNGSSGVVLRIDAQGAAVGDWMDFE